MPVTLSCGRFFFAIKSTYICSTYLKNLTNFLIQVSDIVFETLEDGVYDAVFEVNGEMVKREFEVNVPKSCKSGAK